MGTIFIKRRRRRKSPHIKYIFGHLGFRWSFGIFKLHIPMVPTTLMEGSDPNKKKKFQQNSKFSQVYLCSNTKISTNFSTKKFVAKTPKKFPKTHVYFLLLLKLG
jgi:hypothetical protein